RGCASPSGTATALCSRPGPDPAVHSGYASAEVRMADERDFMPIQGIDHVEYYVGNARQAAYFYSKAFGFHVTAYAGPETKVRDRASWVCESGEARYVFTGAMGPESFIAKHQFEHGDGVRDVALRVPDATDAYEQ